MRHRMWLAAALLAVTPVAADQPLTLRLSQPATTAPANLIVQISVATAADNRSLTVSIDSDQYYRSSEVALDGDEARRTHTFEFRNLPSGSYEIRAMLRGSGKKPKAFADGRTVVY
ncbi:MAG TPA: hypothetical protein VI485_03045 [Vicinamibacterales bacterium]|nr:hypothetical protein [Vicinamibacterales bacterium]